MEHPISITAIWLRKIGDYTEVLFEKDEEWFLAIREPSESNFSHLLEANGMRDVKMCPMERI